MPCSVLPHSFRGSGSGLLCKPWPRSTGCPGAHELLGYQAPGSVFHLEMERPVRTQGRCWLAQAEPGVGSLEPVLWWVIKEYVIQVSETGPKMGEKTERSWEKAVLGTSRHSQDPTILPEIVPEAYTTFSLPRQLPPLSAHAAGHFRLHALQERVTSFCGAAAGSLLRWESWPVGAQDLLAPPPPVLLQEEGKAGQDTGSPAFQVLRAPHTSRIGAPAWSHADH